MSPKYSLNEVDIERWSRNLLIFSSPAIIAFLVALQSGVPIRQAALAIYPAIINALIDLLKKYSAGTA